MKETTFKIYNDIFKEDDRNSSKFYVLYNPNMRFLLTANEMCTFYQIVHICNLNRNSASLNFLAKLLKTSNKTLQKTTNQLITLKLISRNRSHYGTYYYTLNLEVIAEIYDKLNSCHTLEDREIFCKKYIEDCEKNAVSKNDTPMEEITIPMEKNSTPMENFTTGMEKITTPPMEKFTTHISNIFIKKDEFHNKNEFNNENESHNKDVEVEEQANAETLNGTANANSSFNRNSTNVDKESVSTDDVITKMFPELPIEDRKKQADANNSNGVADAETSSNINLNKSSRSNSNKTSVSIKNKSNSSIEEGTLNREPKNSTDVDSNNVNNGTADAGISSNNDKIEEQANADSNDVNKALVSIENEKTTDCSNEGKSFNREPENDVVADSNDDDFFDEIFTDATIEEVDSNEYAIKQTVIKEETINEEKALAMEYYSKILNVTSIEELVLFSTEIKQLPIGEKYLNELLQLISSKEENFNEEKREVARTFNLEKTIQNNPMFSDWYYMLKHIIDECDLRALLSYQRALESGIDEFSNKETAALQEVIDEGIFALQMKHCVA